MDFSAEQAVGVGLCALWLHNNLAHLRHLVYAPPFVTILLCVINCTIHMFPTFGLGFLNKVKKVMFFQSHSRRLRRRGERDYLDECLHPERRLEQLSYNLHDVLHQREWYRVVSFHFVHLDDNHLLFNMVALIALGPSLERSYGSLHFASVVMSLVVLQPLLMIVLALCVFATQPLHGVDILQRRLVGFSGVLFSLLVIEQFSSPSSQAWVGLTGSFGAYVDKRAAVFLQLIVVQFTLQHVSFVGHLCGVVAGIVYITVVSPLQHVILNTVLEQQETVFVFGQSLAIGALVVLVAWFVRKAFQPPRYHSSNRVGASTTTIIAPPIDNRTTTTSTLPPTNETITTPPPPPPPSPSSSSSSASMLLSSLLSSSLKISTSDSHLMSDDDAVDADDDDITLDVRRIRLERFDAPVIKRQQRQWPPLQPRFRGSGTTGTGTNLANNIVPSVQVVRDPAEHARLARLARLVPPGVEKQPTVSARAMAKRQRRPYEPLYKRFSGHGRLGNGTVVTTPPSTTPTTTTPTTTTPPPQTTTTASTPMLTPIQTTSTSTISTTTSVVTPCVSSSLMRVSSTTNTLDTSHSRKPFKKNLDYSNDDDDDDDGDDVDDVDDDDVVPSAPNHSGPPRISTRDLRQARMHQFQSVVSLATTKSSPTPVLRLRTHVQPTSTSTATPTSISRLRSTPTSTSASTSTSTSPLSSHRHWRSDDDGGCKTTRVRYQAERQHQQQRQQQQQQQRQQRGHFDNDNVIDNDNDNQNDNANAYDSDNINDNNGNHTGNFNADSNSIATRNHNHNHNDNNNSNITNHNTNNSNHNINNSNSNNNTINKDNDYDNNTNNNSISNNNNGVINNINGNGNDHDHRETDSKDAFLLGEHCSECLMLDFLAVTCRACSHVFCGDCLANHECDGSQNRRRNRSLLQSLLQG